MEWLIIELLVLGWAVYELVSVRRSMRRDRAAKAAEAPIAQRADVERRDRSE